MNIRNNIAVSIIVAIFLLSLSEIAAREAIPQISADVNFAGKNFVQESVYILREYNGMIALFAPGDDSPCEIYDVMVEDLPQSDIIALRAGISIASEEQLRQMIEDYSS